MLTCQQRTTAPSLFVVLILLTLPLPARALTPSEVFEQVKDSVFVVKTLDTKGKQKDRGSAVLLPTGKIATNCHVVEGGARFEVGRDEQFVAATLYAEGRDICILDAPGIVGKPAQLGRAASLKVGVPVYAVGAPQGLALALSDGIVSNLRGGKPPVIQTTAALSPGFNGGGLFDSEARLVGFITLHISGGQNLKFAMPVEWLAEIKPGSKMVRSQGDWHKNASALEGRKDWTGLLAWCQQWVKAESKNAVAWYSLGFAHSKLNRATDAIEAYRQALHINPEFAEAWYNLGNAYADLKRTTDAIEAYRQALHINPEFADAWYNLAIAHELSDDRTAALEAVKTLRRLDPGRAKRLFNLIVPR